MPYIGRGPNKSGSFRILDDISGSFNGSNTSFALTVGSAALNVGLPETLLIAVDGVLQEPGSAYTISGSNIVFGSAPQESATFWGVELGDVGGLADRATTQSAGDNSTKVATTAYVDAQVATEDTLDELNDTTITSIASGELLKWNGSAWVNNTLAEAGIANTTYSTSWVDSSNDAILRLTPSTGSADDLTLVAGTGVTLTPSGDNLTIAVAAVPAGAIIMWHGLIANIPSGWVLCNGSNGTPDLRGQFVQGAANGVEAGATGGSNTAAPAAHSNHSVTQPSNHAALADHQHAVPLGIWGNGSMGSNVSGWGTGGSFTITKRSLYTWQNVSSGGTAALSKGAAAGTPDSHSGTAVDAHSAHSISDSRPTFYTILYIMKT